MTDVYKKLEREGLAYFDEAAADRICTWFDEYIESPEKGQVKLPDWARAHLRNVYGWKWVKDDTRIVRTFYLEIPKKNFKSHILSGLSLYHLCADGEKFGHGITVAQDKEQAGIVFDAAKWMAGRPKLAKNIRAIKARLTHPKSQSKFEVMSSIAETKEGLKLSFLGIDELHIHKSPKLFNTLRGSGLSRTQPMCAIATTAGDHKIGIGYETHDYACRVRDGKVHDPSFYPVVYGIEPGDSPDDPAVWRKCNPNFGITFNERDFETLYREAKAKGPGAFLVFQRYHLNKWTASIAAWLPMEKWDICGQKTFTLDTLKGRSCYPGGDLSSITDLTAIALAFPNPDASYDIWVKCFMPMGRVSMAQDRDMVPYLQWAEQGYLELTNGDAIDQKVIFKRVCELAADFPFIKKQFRLDPYNAPTFCQDLMNEGFEVVPVSPTARGISPPSKELLRLVTDTKIHHANNPLLSWQASQTNVMEDTEGNIRPVKGTGEHRTRIDGILSIIYALSGALVNKPEKVVESNYEKRGVLYI